MDKKGALMSDQILDILDELTKDEFEKFIFYLNQGVLEECKPIPRGQLDGKSRTGVASLMKSYYGNQMRVKITLEILKKIERNDLIERLEDNAKKKAESKQCDETDSGPSAKRSRIEKPLVEEPDRENRNETYSGTNCNFAFYTLSKLHEHIEDPANAESMVTSLEQRLEEAEMKRVKSWLQNTVPKSTVVFGHKKFRDMHINRDLSTFLEYKQEAKFPKKVVQFFVIQSKGPGVQDMTAMDAEFLLPAAESTLCHPKINCKREADSISMNTSLTESWDSGYDTSSQKSSQSINDPPQEAQRDFGMSIGTTLSKCQQSDPEEAVAPRASVTSAATPASVAPTATPAFVAPAAIPASVTPVATPGTVASAASSADASSAGPVDANGGRPNNSKPKRRQNRQVHNKTKHQRDVLLRFLKQQIPSEKLGTSQEAEELNKIKACVTNVSVREHPRYPLLMAYNCKVFRDPQTNQRKLIEIVDSKDEQDPSDFKVQFHMWLLGLTETVVLWETGEKVIKVKSFEDEEKRFQRYLHEVVVPVLAVYKKLENEEFFKLT